MKFLDIFNPIQKGDFGLTDESIYASLQNGGNLIPLWGGNSEHKSIARMISVNTKTKSGSPITIFSGEGIIISLDGSAGCMTYKKGEAFALNHHAGFITVRAGQEKVISPEYFALFFKRFYTELSVSDGSKTLSLEQIYSEAIHIPAYNAQCKVVEIVSPLLEKLDRLVCLKQDLEVLLSRELE